MDFGSRPLTDQQIGRIPVGWTVLLAMALFLFAEHQAWADVAPIPPTLPEKQMLLPESVGIMLLAFYALITAVVVRLAYLGLKKLSSLTSR